MDIKERERRDKFALPFYAWECITLQLKHRDIDLVIKSEEEMRCFLIFLIVKLNTHNGMINSI